MSRELGKNLNSNQSTPAVLTSIRAFLYTVQIHFLLLTKVNEISRLFKLSDKEAAKSHKKLSAELIKAEKRKIEVNRLFVKLYEDWTSERITEYNFKMLSQKYQAEQQELVEKIDKLKAKLATEKQTAPDAEKWVALIKQYSESTELTAEMLNTLIEKIVVHEATKDPDGTRTQEIEIFYRFVGKID